MRIMAVFTTKNNRFINFLQLFAIFFAKSFCSYEIVCNFASV